jgi:hypothetical protein
MDWLSALGGLTGGSDASPAAPQYLQTTTGAINVGVPAGMNRGAIMEPIMAGGSPFTGGYGIEPYNRFGFSQGGNPTYAGVNASMGMPGMVLLAVGGVLAIYMLKKGGR